MALKVVQLTDTHLFADPAAQLLGCATYPALQRILEDVEAERPDLILVTGDLSQDGSPAAYEHLRALLAPIGAPCYWVPGNHDNREVMARTLNRAPFQSLKSFGAGGWRFLLLDSQVPGHTHGALSDETLAWLRARLREHPYEPTVVALHHPPFPVGSNWLDPICLHAPEKLIALVEDAPQVRLVLTGHVHQNAHRRIGAADCYATRSTGFQFKPGSYDFALGEEAPGFRSFTLLPNGTHHMQFVQAEYACELDLTAQGY